MSDSCPHPEKRWHATKAAAKLALRRERSVLGRDTIHVYRCACGGFHLGHKLGSRTNSRPRVLA